MTIIVATSEMMAADTMQFAGGRFERVVSPKIRRLPDGGLVGTCGSADDGYVFKEWAAAGFPANARPELTEPDDGFRALHLRPDGTGWLYYTTARCHPTRLPAMIGETTAVAFVAGALACGVAADEAVRLAIEQCVWIGGLVQVERPGAPT